MQMTDGDGQGVGGIHGLGRFVEGEQSGDHVLHLLLLGSSIADYGRLDGKRRVFGDLQSCGGSGEHGHTADLSRLSADFTFRA